MTHNSKNKNLYYLNELSDYKISSEDPDVRGWPVKDADNRVIGKVDNLLVNKDIMKVLYLDVEVDATIIEANHDPYGKPASEGVHEFINKEGENHIIIPVGLVNLNTDHNFVVTNTINHQTFSETKRFEKGGHIQRDYEVVVLESYDRDKKRNSPTANSNEFQGEKSYLDSRNEHPTPRDPTYQKSIRNQGDTSEPRTDDLDWERRESEKRAMEAGQEGDSGRIPEDNFFYERKEFDSSNYRKKK